MACPPVFPPMHNFAHPASLCCHRINDEVSQMVACNSSPKWPFYRPCRRRAGLPPELADEIRDRVPTPIENKKEALALRSAVDYYIPLHFHSDFGHPWILVPYERLVSSEKQEIKRIFQYVGTQPPPQSFDHLSSKSNSKQNKITNKPNAHLSKWKHILSKENINIILKITESMDLKFYSDDIEPDYKALSDLQSKKGRLDTTTLKP